VVDDSEIAIGDTVLVDCSELEVLDIRKVNDYYNEQFLFEGNNQIHMDYCKKIIAHLPLNNSPILTGVALLPPLEQEDDVERLIKIEQEASYKQGKGTISWYEQEKRKEYYNKAKEKYSLSNIIDLYIEETRCGMDMWSKEENEVMTTIGKIIQSLSQPKMPVGFECEESVFFATNAFSSDITLTSEGLQDTVLKGIKTTTNSQGHIQWVGKYIY
jgi:hypothetical protein